MKALTTRMLVSIATRLFRTVAAMIAPCSVKASGKVPENLSLRRWSQIATTSSISAFVNSKTKSAGKRSLFRCSGSEQKNAAAAEALGITAQAYSSNRKCPFCAEYVKAEARVCRFCQKDLPRLDASRSELSEIRTDMDRNQAHADEQKPLLDRLGVEQRDGLFYYHGKGYHSLSDIPFGKK